MNCGSSSSGSLVAKTNVAGAELPQVPLHGKLGNGQINIMSGTTI